MQTKTRSKMIPNRAIIIGGGSSIRENLWHIKIRKLPIWKAIKDEFTIGTNFSFKWFKSTVQMYGDYQFYDIHKEQLNKLNLVIGRFDDFYANEQRNNRLKIPDNIYLVENSEDYNKQHINKLYCFQLIGLAGLSLAIQLECREIYLLGYDACEIDGYTHFYDVLEGTYLWRKNTYCGVGRKTNNQYRTNNYNNINELNNKWFAPFKKAVSKNIKIYNVSLKSKIEIFPKIGYSEFYYRLNENIQKIHQNEIQEEIKKRFNLFKVSKRITK